MAGTISNWTAYYLGVISVLVPLVLVYIIILLFPTLGSRLILWLANDNNRLT